MTNRYGILGSAKYGAAPTLLRSASSEFVSMKTNVAL